MKRALKGLRITLTIASILFFNGCNSVGLPELGTPDIALPELPSLGFGLGSKTEAAIPISVSYAFDATITQATLEVDGCGFPYTIKSGEIIPQAFLAMGQKQFNSVAAYEGSGQAVQTSQQTDLTVYLQLTHQSFETPEKSAQEDTFLASINLQILATFIDSNGKQLAQTPLNYSAEASLWTPALMVQAGSCLTSSYDEEINRAAAELARQLVSIVPQVIKPVAQQPLITQTTSSGQNQVRQAILPAMKFRTMLKDGNNNLILEGGEVLVLQIEATNSGRQPVSAINIDLAGHRTLLRAFSDITPLPISLGDFQPGETKTAEIRGRMPRQVSDNKGELIVTLRPRGGPPVGSHRILAALQSPTPTGKQDASRQLFSSPQQQKIGHFRNKYVAILIGMDRYRDTWRQAYRVRTGQMKVLKDTLQTTGLFSETNIRMLRGVQATKTDIEEVLLSWGRQRLEKDSILIFHFSGQAVSHPATGEVYLVPFEGSPKASLKRLISLRTLQRVLRKLENRLTLLILDTPVTSLLRQSGAISTNGSIPTRWTSGLPLLQKQGTKVIQIRKKSLKSNDGPAELLAGLLGQADANRNGTITLGEFLHDVHSISEITAAPSKHSSEALLPLTQ